MLRAYCSHCQGTSRGTKDNPAFSIKEIFGHGFPLVEVLKDGGQVGWWDEHFQFSVRKAQMLLSCLPLLKEFWQSSDEQRRNLEPKIMPNDVDGSRIRVYVKMYPEFELASGRTIDKPYLYLQALPPYDETIGLGAVKCRAICEVAEDLRKWLAKHQRVS
jgi:hypothetical protein